MVAAIRDKRLDGFAGTGEGLYFVKNDETASGKRRNAQHEEEPVKERIQPRQILYKRLLDISSDVFEIDDVVGRELRLGEFLDDEALPDATRSVYKQGTFVHVVPLPCQQGFGDFPFHGHLSFSSSEILYHVFDGLQT